MTSCKHWFRHLPSHCNTERYDVTTSRRPLLAPLTATPWVVTPPADAWRSVHFSMLKSWTRSSRSIFGVQHRSTRVEHLPRLHDRRFAVKNPSSFGCFDSKCICMDFLRSVEVALHMSNGCRKTGPSFGSGADCMQTLHLYLECPTEPPARSCSQADDTNIIKAMPCS